jgi:hypothetical protein
MPTNAELVTLHRYYIWANKFRIRFDQTMERRGAPEPDSMIWFADDTGCFLSYWYAALYVVVEGWQELGCQDQGIDRLLVSPNVQHLKRYRHGVCHFQRKYLDERFLEMTASPDSVQWVRSLHGAFGRFFLERKHE